MKFFGLKILYPDYKTPILLSCYGSRSIMEHVLETLQCGLGYNRSWCQVLDMSYSLSVKY